MAESLRILILEDNPTDVELIQFELQEAGLTFSSKVVMTEEAFIHEIEEHCPDLILSDYDLPRYNGALALIEANRRCPGTPFILVTGAVSEDRAIEILTQGAKDYVLKSRLQQRLASAVQRALAEAREHTARKQAEVELREAHRTLEERVKTRTVELEVEVMARKKMEESLRESEEQFRTIFEVASVGIVQADSRTGRILRCNEAYGRITGYSLSELLERSFLDFTHPEDRQHDWDIFSRAARNELPGYHNEKRYIRKDGSIIWVRLDSAFVRDSNGQSIRTVAICMDITDRKQAEGKLREVTERLHLATVSARAGVWDWNLQTKEMIWDERMFELYGLTKENFPGGVEAWERGLHPDDSSRAIEECQAALRGEQDFDTEFRVRRPDGTVVHIKANGFVLRDEGGKPLRMIGLNTDITERKKTEEALRESERKYRELSIIDDLTQLYNSRYFHHQLKTEIDRVNRYGQSLTLLLLDIDNFKAFNDTYGHVEGDQVLSRLGQVVRRCLRQTDSAYRYGGEEFTIILPMTASQQGVVISERTKAEFKKENFSPDTDEGVNITLSVGVAQYRTQEDLKAFVHRVDQLMYQAKKDGKDRVCCES